MASKDITQTEVVVQIPTITVTPNDLRDAFLKWETAARLGGWAPVENRTVERAAEVSAATLWNHLVS